MIRKLLLITILVFACQNIIAQDKQLSVISPHPDMKVKVTKCKAVGKTVYLEMLFINEGDEDVKQEIMLYNNWSDIYDSEGNGFVDINSEPIKAKVGNGEYSIAPNYSLIVGVPAKVSLRIQGVPNSAEYLARVRLWVRCLAWGLGSQNKLIIRNIPINRN